MKQVIAGKLYNTESATEIGWASSPEPRSDFRWWHETLYKTQRGAYFLCGSGGPMTSWQRPAGGGGVMGGSGIRAMSETEAREWAEKWLMPSEYLAEWAAEEA